MFGIFITYIQRFLVPLVLFIWALFSPHIAGYTYIIIYGLFAGYLIIIDKLKPKPNLKKWTMEEYMIIRKYHLALRFPNGAKDMSVFLNGFRWASFVWIVLLLINKMWIPAIFLVIAFFITADISVRLDPFYFLGDAVQKGQDQFAYDLLMLQNISERMNKKN